MLILILTLYVHRLKEIYPNMQGLRFGMGELIAFRCFGFLYLNVWRYLSEGKSNFFFRTCLDIWDDYYTRDNRDESLHDQHLKGSTCSWKL